MDPQILTLIEKERVLVLAVPLQDGTPHAAEVHYSHTFEPLTLYIQTYPTVKTAVIRSNGGSAPASVVVGLKEEDFVSLQMRGNIRIIEDKTELDAIYKIHYKKLPESEKYKNTDTIFLAFTPTWWRYSDFNTDPETILEIT